MTSSHPLLHIDWTWCWSIFCSKLILLSMLMTCTLLSCTWLEILLEMLKKSHLLLESLREVTEWILGQNILLFIIGYWFTFVVVEASSFIFCYNLCRIIEENTCWLIWKKITQTILSGVVYPFCHPDCALASLLYLLLLLRWKLTLWLEVGIWIGLCYLGKTMSTLGIPSNSTSHRVSWRWSFNLYNLRSWLLLITIRSCIMLHCMIWLGHHLWRQLCTTLWLFLLESYSITWLILELCWSCFRLLGIFDAVIVRLIDLHVITLRSRYDSVPSATHRPLVNHQLNIWTLGVKSSTNIWLSWVVVRSIISLRHELSNILSRWRTCKEWLRKILWNLSTMIQEIMLEYLVKIWSSGWISI